MPHVILLHGLHMHAWYGVGIILTPLERKQKKAKILKETKI